MVNLKRNFKFNNTTLINFINLTDREEYLVRNWRNNQSVRKWMYSKHRISIREHSEFIESLKKDDRNFYWLLKNKTRGYAGVISLNKIDLANKNAYLGIYKNPNSNLSELGYMLIRCLKKLAFDVAILHTLKLEVIGANKIAIRFFEKSGFSREGKLKGLFFKDRRYHDVIVMGILRKDRR